MKTPQNNEDVQMITSKLMAIHLFSFSFFFLNPPLFSGYGEDAPKKLQLWIFHAHNCTFMRFHNTVENRLDGKTERRRNGFRAALGNQLDRDSEIQLLWTDERDRV